MIEVIHDNKHPASIMIFAKWAFLYQNQHTN